MPDRTVNHSPAKAVVFAALTAVRDTGRIGFISRLDSWAIRSMEADGLIRFADTGYTITKAGERRIEELKCLT